MGARSVQGRDYRRRTVAAATISGITARGIAARGIAARGITTWAVTVWAGAALAANPADAPADAMAGAAEWFTLLGWAAAVAALGVSLVMALRFARARIAEQAIGEALLRTRADHADARAILDVVAAHWLVQKGDTVLAGSELAGLFALPAVTATEDIAAVLTPAGARQFQDACAALRESGTPFDLLLAAGGRLVAAAGQELPERAGIAIRFQDVTAIRAERRELSAESRRSASEYARLAALLDQAPLPAWSRDPSGRLAWCNRTYAAMVERSPEEAVAAGAELASTLEAEQPRRLAALARSTATAQEEVRRFVVQGDRRTFRVIELPPGADGAQPGFALDITAEAEARAEMERHIAAHASVLQMMSDGIAIHGPDTRLTFYNQAFRNLWDLDDAFLDSAPTFSAVLDELRAHRRLPEQYDWARFREQMQAMFTNLIAAQEEMLFLPDGRTFRRVTSPHPFGGLLFLYTDVTDRLHLERDRNTLLAVQSASLDSLYEGVVVFGADGQVNLHNKAFAQMWQIPPSLLAQRPHFNDVMDAMQLMVGPAEDARILREELLGAFNDHAERSGQLAREDQSVLDYAAIPLPDGAMLVSCLDVTASKRIEQALQERNAALHEADLLKSEFVANVSYELRTPLNAIIGFNQLLQQEYFGKINDKQREYVDGALEASHSLLQLINDLLDLATIEAGRMVLEPVLFDLCHLIAGIHALVQERVRRQSLRMTLNYPDTPCLVMADEKRIKQLLFNLVGNAIKFTPPGGHIEIGVRREDGGVRLWVADDGIGIPPEAQSRLFEKFQRAESAGRSSGAGLGLALVRSFIELHGGTVNMVSGPGQGTRVTCLIPDLADASPRARLRETG